MDGIESDLPDLTGMTLADLRDCQDPQVKAALVRILREVDRSGSDTPEAIAGGGGGVNCPSDITYQSAIPCRAIDDPVVLARIARIFREALKRLDREKGDD